MDIHHSDKQGGYKPVPLKGHNPPLPPDNWPYNGHPTTPHDPEFGLKNPKFERHVYISRDQIFFDLDSQIQMVAMSRRKDDGTEDDRMTNSTTTFKEMFYRWIDKHIGLAKSKMQSFVLEKMKTANMNSIKDVEEVDICLLMPEWWDDTVFDQLTTAVHDYIVNAVLQEYFTLTLTSKDPVTVDKAGLASDSLSDIRKYANSAKPGRIRKPFKPF